MSESHLSIGMTFLFTFDIQNESFMKTMTCKQLGGACDKVFTAKNFAEMAALSRQHGIEMYQKGDKPHIEAMAQMQKLIQSPNDMNNWFQTKQKEFENLPETN